MDPEVAQKSSNSGNIRVCVRIRPENAAERSDPKHTKVIQTLDKIVCIDPKPMPGRPTRTRGKGNKYAFDNVFTETASQQDVFENTVHPLLSGLLEGFNATVFAYGATGAGKTYTMMGTDSSASGLIVLTMTQLFEVIKAGRSESEISVSMSYLEVYNETIRDLLIENSKPLELREGEKGQVHVTDLSERHPNTPEEVMNLLEQGTRRRTQGATEANEVSSRSHAVLQIVVNTKAHPKSGMSTPVRTAKLSLIDLAGSERAAVSQNHGIRRKEGCNINRSLLALGNCINALAKLSNNGNNRRKGKNGVVPMELSTTTPRKGKKGVSSPSAYVPYRDSKLTRMLKDSLGGNCRTVMIANVAPSSKTYEDTHNTLKYAGQCKNIKIEVRENVQSVALHLSEYKSVISQLQKENEELQTQLKAATTNKSVASRPPTFKRDNAMVNWRQSFHRVADQQRQHKEALRETEKRIKTTFTDIRKYRLDIMQWKVSEKGHNCNTEPSSIQCMRTRIRDKEKELRQLEERRSILRNKIHASAPKHREAVNPIANQSTNPLAKDIMDLEIQLHEKKIELLDQQVVGDDLLHSNEEMKQKLREYQLALQEAHLQMQEWFNHLQNADQVTPEMQQLHLRATTWARVPTAKTRELDTLFSGIICTPRARSHSVAMDYLEPPTSSRSRSSLTHGGAPHTPTPHSYRSTSVNSLAMHTPPPSTVASRSLSANYLSRTTPQRGGGADNMTSPTTPTPTTPIALPSPAGSAGMVVAAVPPPSVPPLQLSKLKTVPRRHPWTPNHHKRTVKSRPETNIVSRMGYSRQMLEQKRRERVAERRSSGTHKDGEHGSAKKQNMALVVHQSPRGGSSWASAHTHTDYPFTPNLPVARSRSQPLEFGGCYPRSRNKKWGGNQQQQQPYSPFQRTTTGDDASGNLLLLDASSTIECPVSDSLLNTVVSAPGSATSTCSTSGGATGGIGSAHTPSALRNVSTRDKAATVSHPHHADRHVTILTPPRQQGRASLGSPISHNKNKCGGTRSSPPSCTSPSTPKLSSRSMSAPALTDFSRRIRQQQQEEEETMECDLSFHSDDMNDAQVDGGALLLLPSSSNSGAGGHHPIQFKGNTTTTDHTDLINNLIEKNLGDTVSSNATTVVAAQSAAEITTTPRQNLSGGSNTTLCNSSFGESVSNRGSNCSTPPRRPPHTSSTRSPPPLANCTNTAWNRNHQGLSSPLRTSGGASYSNLPHYMKPTKASQKPSSTTTPRTARSCSVDLSTPRTKLQIARELKKQQKSAGKTCHGSPVAEKRAPQQHSPLGALKYASRRVKHNEGNGAGSLK